MAQINLRALSSLHDYSNAELKMLASAAPAREYEVGDCLCKESMIGQSCFLLATGEVEVIKHLDGADKVLATLRAGAIVGQMALVDRSPRSATVRSKVHTIALELTRDVFERLLSTHSPLATRFQNQIAVAGIRQLRMATRKLADLMAKDADQQVPARAQVDGATTATPRNRREQLLTVQAALSEWDMSLDDLDKVQVSIPRGQMTMSELRSRRDG